MKTAHVSDEKKKLVSEFVKLIEEYPIIAAVNMENLPAKQLQNMRTSLRETVVMRMTKRRLMKIAIEEAKTKKTGIEALEEHLKGMPALMFTKENPFKLYKKLEKSKSKAPAKAGQTAPNDIVVKAGATPFAPGPVIGELGALGLKTGVENGKVAIKEDKVVVKEGDEINAATAGLLTRLGIEPMEVGLNVTAVYEDGSIFTKDILAVDETQYIKDVTQAASWAFNLAVEASVMNDATTEVLVQKTFRGAKAVALEAGILADAVVEELIGQAEREATSVKTTANIPDSAPAEAPKEEKAPAEEAKGDTADKAEEKPEAEEKSAETSEDKKQETSTDSQS